MLFITLYAMTGDDIRILAFEKKDDFKFQNMNIITIVLFCMEIVLCSIGIPTYFLSFLFWIDLISTFSIMMDIDEIWFGFMGFEDDGSYNDTAELFFAGKQVRMGIKACKLARIVRLIRLMRVMKLYRNADNLV